MFNEEKKMDLMKMGTALLASKLGGGVDSSSITSALGGLLSNGSGGLDLGSIVTSMNDKGMGSIVGSWLGNGDNDSLSTDQVRNLVGSDKISEMASKLNTDEGSLLDGLKDALPQIIDKSSSGGSLLDNVGDLGGMLNMAKNLF